MKNELMEDIDFNTWFEPWTNVDLEKGPEWVHPTGFDKGLIDWESVLEMADRREWVKSNAKPCPYCGTMQVQLTQWQTPTLQFKCRHCKQKFVRTVPPTPVGCEPYCACPACFGPGHEAWYAKGSPTLCTDGKVHYMTHPGYPIEETK